MRRQRPRPEPPKPPDIVVESLRQIEGKLNLVERKVDLSNRRLDYIYRFLRGAFRVVVGFLRFIAQRLTEAVGIRLKWTGSDGEPLENNVGKIKHGEWIKATLEILDAQGAPATVDGVPTWHFDGGAAVESRVAEDGMSAEFHDLPGVESGVFSGSVTADADRGEGVREISVPFTVEVEVDPATDAVELRVAFGDPQPQVPVEPPVE